MKKIGFTLIELMVVISIIAFLAAVSVVSLKNARAKGRDAQRYANLNQLAKALDIYHQENGSYPTTGGSWWSVCPVGGSRGTSGANGWIPNLAPRYISVLPINPTGCVGGSIKGYVYISNGTDYKIAADWNAEIGDQCGVGKQFYDSRCGVATSCTFCSVYSNGYRNR